LVKRERSSQTVNLPIGVVASFYEYAGRTEQIDRDLNDTLRGHLPGELAALARGTLGSSGWPGMVLVLAASRIVGTSGREPGALAEGMLQTDGGSGSRVSASC
jgi:hypothetical protein